MKSVLIAIQPYWVFLIIARIMGWRIPQEKTVEVRKDYPKDAAWNRRVYIYCSKNRKSFNRIPAQYQPFMEKFLGKVVGEFVSKGIDKYCGRLTTYAETPYKNKYISAEELAKTCLSIGELNDYLNGSNAYLWHISDLKIYDKPKELGEFGSLCKEGGKDNPFCDGCHYEKYYASEHYSECLCDGIKPLTSPPQSWCYVEV